MTRQTIPNLINEKLQPIDGSSPTYERKKSIDHPKRTAQDLIELDFVLNHSFYTNEQIAFGCDFNVSGHTISNYLRKIDYSNCIAAKKPFINGRNIIKRYERAMPIVHAIILA